MPRKPFGANGTQFERLHVEGADDAEEDQDGDVHHGQGPGQPGALADADHQHPRDAHHDQERRQVQDHGDAVHGRGRRERLGRARHGDAEAADVAPCSWSWATCSAAFAAVG